MAERFHKTWRGELVSSEGFSVHLSGDSTLVYKDATGKLRVKAKAMASPALTVVVYTKSIPDLPERTRAQVVDNISRAFVHAGWGLIAD